MKKLLALAVLGLSIGTGVALWAWLASSVSPRPAVLTARQLQALAVLVTLRAQVQDVQETSLRGYLGSRRVVAIVQGEILVGADLSRVRLEQVQERSAVVVLASPRVISARLDHDRTRIVSNQASGLWLIASGDAGRTVAADRAYAQAQTRLAAAANDPVLIEQARQQAERVIREFGQSLGVRVEVRWDP